MIDRGTSRADLAGCQHASRNVTRRCPLNSKRLWQLWQALFLPFSWCFTRPGFRRFVEWLPGLALNAEEHTVTQSLIGLGRADDWKALEAFAEFGAWDRDAVE